MNKYIETGKFLVINGFEMPFPKPGVAIRDVNISDGGRNANGTLSVQKVGRTQYKIENLVFPYLTNKLWEMIAQSTKENSLKVEFYAASVGKRIEIKMYASDRIAIPYRIDWQGNPTAYKDCSFNLIDIGEQGDL